MRPRSSAVENIGPIASSVGRFLSPSVPSPPVCVWLIRCTPPRASGAPCAGDDAGIKVRTSNVNRLAQTGRARHEAMSRRDVSAQGRSARPGRERDVNARRAASPLRVRSVVGLAYDELGAMIVDGRLAPGARLGQRGPADA